MNKDFENAYTPFLEEYKDIFGYKPYIHDYRCSQDEFFVALIKAIATKKNIAHFVEHKHAANVPCSCGGITVVEPKTMISDVGWGKSYFVRYVKCLDCGKQGKGFNDVDNSNPVQLAIEAWLEDCKQKTETKSYMVDESQLTRLREAVAVILDFIDVEDSENAEIIKNNTNIINDILDSAIEINRAKIANKLEIDNFRETLRDCYDYYVSDLSDEDIESILDDIANIVANDDCYNDTYNDAVRTVAKRNNLKYVGDDEWGDEK